MSDSHRLTPDVHEQIFRERIVPELLSNAVPQQYPVLILLGGQPGIGKSSTKGAIHEALAGVGGALDFSADLMRPYHEKFTDLLRGDERVLRDLDTAIDQDVRLWVDKALAYTINRRVNVIFDSNLANPSRAHTITSQFTAAEYETEVMFVAGASALSRLGVLQRYQRQIESQGVGAYCPPEIHDRNYQGVLDTAGLIDIGEIMVDAVHVYRRGGGAPLHTNHREGLGHWVVQPAARQTIIDERARPWSNAESSWFISAATNLAARIADPYAGDLREAIERAQPLLQPADRRTGRTLAAELARRSWHQAAFPKQPGRTSGPPRRSPPRPPGTPPPGPRPPRPGR